MGSGERSTRHVLSRAGRSASRRGARGVRRAPLEYLSGLDTTLAFCKC
jgi:hypothetical protein